MNFRFVLLVNIVNIIYFNLIQNFSYRFDSSSFNKSPPNNETNSSTGNILHLILNSMLIIFLFVCTI